MRAIDDATAEMRRAPVWLASSEAPWRELPQVSEAEAQRRSGVGRDLQMRIDALDLADLPHELRLTAKVARHHAAIWAREADWWWVVCDPLRVGFFGLFIPTAYCGGHMLNEIHKVLRMFSFESAGDLDRYLALLADYARLLDQFAERTRGQAERGIRMPKVQCDGAVELFGALRDVAPRALSVEEARFAGVHRNGFAGQVEGAIRGLIVPAYDRLLGDLDASYRTAAPDAVGMAQYPRGPEIYEELVRLHTTLPLAAAQIHATGHTRMQRISDGKSALAQAAGHPDARAYERAIDADPRWHARTADAVRALFEHSIDRIAPALLSQFARIPDAPVRAAALPAEVSSSMTFGYYGQPTAADPVGTYYFNAVNLTRRALPNVAALTYHELMPGHHLHLGLQLENTSLPELRQRTLINAFNEGWGEYAATLAGEMGMYTQPEEQYGRLMMDAFLTCRLVVDTGMNALGWTLEQARAYLREYSGMSDAEINSETIRYSCDIPAQSLAYKLGDDYFVMLRDEMRARVGKDAFDIRDFHTAVLSAGSLPLPLVADNVRRIAGFRAGS